MEVKFTRSKWGTILSGIAGVVLGVLLFLYPKTTALTFTQIAGWVLTIYGIAALISALMNWNVILSTADLYMGVISLLFGLLILYVPTFFVAWIFILLGIYIMFSGFTMLMGSNAMRVMGVKGSGWGMVLSVLAIILGALVVSSPLVYADATVMVCGIALVYSGIVNVIDGIRMPKELKG